MPRYANGKEAKLGDLVIHMSRNWRTESGDARRTLGSLLIMPGSDSCEAKVLQFAQWDGTSWIRAQGCDCVTLKDCVPIEEARTRNLRRGLTAQNSVLQPPVPSTRAARE